MAVIGGILQVNVPFHDVNEPCGRWGSETPHWSNDSHFLANESVDRFLNVGLRYFVQKITWWRGCGVAFVSIANLFDVYVLIPASCCSSSLCLKAYPRTMFLFFACCYLFMCSLDTPPWLDLLMYNLALSSIPLLTRDHPYSLHRFIHFWPY